MLRIYNGVTRKSLGYRTNKCIRVNAVLKYTSENSTATLHVGYNYIEFCPDKLPKPILVILESMK